jgi:hypothetical protein
LVKGEIDVRSVLVIAMVVVAWFTVGAAELPEQERAAVEAATQWLGLVDGGEYRESWEQAASLFKNAVSAEQWEASVKAARAPLGELVSREVIRAQSATSLPGAPDGKYVVIQYRASFQHKGEALETVTPMRDGGEWRVSGYYIK